MTVKLGIAIAAVGLHQVIVRTRRRTAIRRREYQHFAKLDHLRTRLLRHEHQRTGGEGDDCSHVHGGK